MAPSKNKKRKETQKATDKPQKPWEEAKTIAPGCNCPLGCLIGEVVAEGDDDIVELECSASACTKDSRVHAVCYEHWEGELVKAIEKTNRRGGWRASWVQQHLWTPTCMRHLTSDFTKCQCGGQLVKLEPSISLNREVAAEKPAKKAKHHVPGGVKKLPGLRSSDTKIAGAGAHHQPLISNGLDDDVHQLPEKPKYPVGLTIEPKKMSQSKTSNSTSASKTAVAATSSYPGDRSRKSSVCPSDEMEDDIAQQIAVLNMFKLRHEAERSGWKQVRSNASAGVCNRSAGSSGIKIAGGKFHALISDDSDDEPVGALGDENAEDGQSAVDGDLASVISKERSICDDVPNSSRVDHHIDHRVGSSSGYNDIDHFYNMDDSYDISKHCVVADVDPFAYSRHSAHLTRLVRQMFMYRPIQPPHMSNAFY